MGCRHVESASTQLAVEDHENLEEAHLKRSKTLEEKICERRAISMDAMQVGQ